ncbi:hypothetical protein AB1Y20_016307 [Prymnesium parvum]|uniref:Uncharacterized protein n=1 Tax=Prymnesium parvum TaxID=97485 RepID=A0AB34ICC8_PRYPA
MLQVADRRQMPLAAELWLRCRWWLFLLLLVIAPVYFHALVDGGLLTLASWWVVPLMAAAAAIIPASGAPVAGGILFFPVLRAHQVCPHDAVAFSAITQLIGCGVFTPLNWLISEPNVFVSQAWKDSFVPAGLGVVLALSVGRLRGCHGEHYLIGIFGCFCFLLMGYVLHGLFFQHMGASNKVGTLSRNRMRACAWFLPFVAAGMVTGYIGICIEKVLFVYLTLSGELSVKQVSVSSITLVGWVSAIATVMHALAPRDPSAPGYIGAVPYELWLLGLPGIFLGSIAGPHVSRIVGQRPILAAFAVGLAYESMNAAVFLWREQFWTDCELLVRSESDFCVPQKKGT